MAGTTETPVLDLVANMTTASIEASSLDPETLMLVRIAALVAVDAPPVSYAFNLAAAGDLEIDPEQVRGVLRQSPRSSGRPALLRQQATSCGPSRWPNSRRRSRRSDLRESRGVGARIAVKSPVGA